MMSRTIAIHHIKASLKAVLPLVLPLGVLLLSGSCQEQSEKAPAQETSVTTPEKVDTLNLLVSQIKKCSRLYTSSFKVHRIITHADQLKLKGSILSKDFSIDIPASDRKVAIPIDATLKGFIDFSKFSEQNVIYSGDKVEIILPDPEVELTSTRIVHDKVSSQVSWFRSEYSDKELSYFEKQGRQSIINSVPELQVIERSRSSAAHILIPLVSQLGFDKNNITITFRKDLNANTLKIISEQH